MVISDLVTSKEVDPGSANSEKWSSCIDGALTKERYLESIRIAGFKNIQILQETPYSKEEEDTIDDDGSSSSSSRKITSLVIRAIK
jgi:arsenite methyltransferase